MNIREEIEFILNNDLSGGVEDELVSLFKKAMLEILPELIDCGCGRHRPHDGVEDCFDPEVRIHNILISELRRKING